MKIRSKISPVSSKPCTKETSSAPMAKTEWAAIQAAEKLQVTWSPPQFKLPGNPDELYALLKNTKSFTTLKGAKKAMPRPRSAKQKNNTKRPIVGRFRCTG